MVVKMVVVTAVKTVEKRVVLRVDRMVVKMVVVTAVKTVD